MEAENLSRHELKVLHRNVHRECQVLSQLHSALRLIFQELHNAYIERFEVFPLMRYGKMKKMIKRTITADNFHFVLSVVEAAALTPLTAGDTRRLDRLLSLSGQDGDTGSDGVRPLTSGSQPHGKGKQLFRYFQKATGMDTDPIEDEDVMENEELHRKIKKFQKDLEVMYKDFRQADSTMKELSTVYEESKGRILFSRYFILKNSVRRAISETKADTKYDINS